MTVASFALSWPSLAPPGLWLPGVWPPTGGTSSSFVAGEFAITVGRAELVGLIASLVVGVTLLFAGAVKVTDFERWKVEAGQLGVNRSTAITVPIVELLTGALLVVGVGFPVVPMVAAALLVVFTYRLLRLLQTGEPYRCYCFGVFSAAEISWTDIARNLALITLCALSVLR